MSLSGEDEMYNDGYNDGLAEAERDLITLRAQLAQRDEQLAKAREALDIFARIYVNNAPSSDDRLIRVKAGTLLKAQNVLTALSALTTPEHRNAG